MNRHLFWILAVLLAPGLFPASAAAAEKIPLTQRPWFETRTAHFHLYSCGQAQTAFLVATQLEQFCEAYSLLAGAQAVASPPGNFWHVVTHCSSSAVLRLDEDWLP